MRQQFDDDGALTYLDCTRWSFFAGIISWSQCLERLAALLSLAEQTSSARRYAERVLHLEGYESHGEWPVGEGHVPEDEHPSSNPMSATQDEDPLLYFLPGGNTGLSRWVFHRYDDDFFPSVPHGHGKETRRKLDAYLGWVYAGSPQHSREPRWKIVALWNEAAFRDLALASLHYFVERHPAYVGWRVRNPIRLPRRR